MAPEQVTEARRVLGERWGLGRSLTHGELGHLLRLKPGNAWDTVKKWEEGRGEVSGPVSIAIELMLAGGEPSTKADALKPTRASSSPRGPHGHEAGRRPDSASWVGDPRRDDAKGER